MKLSAKPIHQASASASYKVTKDAKDNIVATWVGQDEQSFSASFVEVTPAELDRRRTKAYPILIP